MKKRKNPNKVRINSGSLRGRCVSFSEPLVRPTKATVRKTLFNWLRPLIRGRRCLDCFSGSGVLAFEAVSEGASYVLCLDRSGQAVQDVRENAQKLGVDGVHVRRGKYPFSFGEGERYDIVFMDPPFGEFDVRDCLQWLSTQSCIQRGCLVYVEAPRAGVLDDIHGFSVYKQSLSAGVRFYLLIFQGEVKVYEE